MTSLRGHFSRVHRSHLAYYDKRHADHNQKERKELAACETAYQLRVGFAQIFEHDPKDRVADEKQSGQNSIWLACARPHKPQNRKQDNPFEKRFVKLRRMTRR